MRNDKHHYRPPPRKELVYPLPAFMGDPNGRGHAPKPDSKRVAKKNIQFGASQQLHDSLRDLAKREGVPMSVLARDILTEGLLRRW